ncbi:hypothetical protein [Persicobacter diffluens]|uniref:Transmembrane protein n=1 Tax=Persicobacter diffluens TaxID=981 RepID=A0AAN4W0F8_9BACT|nr:hypothetical protein PEDI_29980 [Persicobacter diffluens]
MKTATYTDPVYLKKSKSQFKIYGSLLLLSLFSNLIIKPAFPLFPLLGLLIGGPVLVMFFMAPAGLYNAWKSKKNKEGRPQLQFRYFMAHLFFTSLTLLFLVIAIKDLSSLFLPLLEKL